MYRPGTQPKGTPTERLAGTPAAFLNGAALPFPIEMVVDETGEPFTGLIAGDWPGHSPSVLGVGKDGKLSIGSYAELTVTDSRVLPNDLGHTIRQRRQAKTERKGTKGTT